MPYAAAVRPVIDRVYTSMRAAARPYTHEVVAKHGVQPGFITSFYFGLLARPISAESFAALSTYRGSDGAEESDQGLAVRDADGAWHLTDSGRALALDFELAVAEGARSQWCAKGIATMPGLDAVPRLTELLRRLLEAGAATGGPAFRAMAPVHEPEGASPELLASNMLGALRHHRADAHRAAWQGAGLTLAELLEMPWGPPRQAIEDETNRLDAPIYATLSESERLEFLALLGALPG